MATVYLAEDVKHARKVALKVLKEELGAVLGVERFLAEIKVTANLQYPNLLPLFDSGDADGLLFYVMPFIQGETLRARLARDTVLPVDEAVRIAAAMGRALDYAHRQNVVHRDLKPENVMLVEGQPIIADFGIALAVTNAGGARLTQTGLSVGTPQYMSPEQATGEKSVDRRSDIYALAAVAYEMLAGEPPHTGPTASAIIARLVMDTPRSLRSTRGTVPEQVELAIMRGLAKMPADRWPTASEFADAFGKPATAETAGPTALIVTGAGTPGTDSRVVRGLRRQLRAASVVALAALSALVVAAWGWRRPAEGSAQRARFLLTLGDSARLRTDRIGTNVAVSNDGARIAWLGGDPTPRIFVRTLDDITPRPVPGSENAMTPQFAPDGESIAFTIAGRLLRVPLAGGPPATIADEVVNYSWGDNDVVVYSRIPGANAGLWLVGAFGGDPERLTAPDTARLESRHIWPHVLPGGKAALFAVRYPGVGAEGDSLAVVSLADHAITRFGLSGSNPRYAPTGHLLFSRVDGTVRGILFDPASLRMTAPVVPVLGNVATLSGANVGQGGAMTFAFARNGTMLYQPGTPLGQLMRVARNGRASIVRSDTLQYVNPRVSPDGRRVIWWVRAGVARTGNYWAPSDGGGAPRLAFASGAGLTWSSRFNGGFTGTTNPSTGANVSRVSLDATPPTVTPFISTPATETGANVSKDGLWLAFVSNQSGRSEVYAVSTSDSTNVKQVSTHGGDEPVWAAGGRELFYRDGRTLIAAQLETRSGLVVVRRDTLFADIFQMGNLRAQYDVMPDGQSFIMVRSIGAGSPPLIVLNWFGELRERMAQAGK